MRIGIVAGESSGDLLGAGLIDSLRSRVPDLHCEGVAGPAMAAQGCDVIEHSEALALMGLIEPIREIPRLFRLRKTLLSRWMSNPPDAVIGIDSPDFNLGLEMKLRRNGIPTVHYVSPSVWAWRQGRIRKIGASADIVLCLLPFEKTFYDEHGVAAEFVGHPMAERMSANPDSPAARQRLGLAEGRVVAVLPGSRAAEVRRLGPIFAEVCARLNRNAATADLSFVAPMATPALKQMFQEHLLTSGIDAKFHLLDGDSETALTAADVTLIASGTATLEAALLATPMVAAYRVAPLTYTIAVTFGMLKTPHFTLPNLLTSEPMVPELMQHDATPEKLTAAMSDLLADDARRETIIRTFSTLRGLLARGADERAAQAVIELIDKHRTRS